MPFPLAALSLWAPHCRILSLFLPELCFLCLCWLVSATLRILVVSLLMTLALMFPGQTSPQSINLLLNFFLEIYTIHGHLKSMCPQWSHWLLIFLPSPNQSSLSPASYIFWKVFTFVPSLPRPPVSRMNAYHCSPGVTSVACSSSVGL